MNHELPPTPDWHRERAEFLYTRIRHLQSRGGPGRDGRSGSRQQLCAAKAGRRLICRWASRCRHAAVVGPMTTNGGSCHRKSLQITLPCNEAASPRVQAGRATKCSTVSVGARPPPGSGPPQPFHRTGTEPCPTFRHARTAAMARGTVACLRVNTDEARPLARSNSRSARVSLLRCGLRGECGGRLITSIDDELHLPGAAGGLPLWSNGVAKGDADHERPCVRTALQIADCLGVRTGCHLSLTLVN